MICKLTFSLFSRKNFSKILSALFSFSIFFGLSGSAFAVNPEVFAASGSLAVSGDSATTTGTMTLTIPAAAPGGPNLGGNTGGPTYAVDAATAGTTVQFIGGASTVTGTMGITGSVLANIIGGSAGSSIIFNGQVDSTAITFNNASTMTFNDTTAGGNSGAVAFGVNNGTLILGPNVELTGAATATAANTGIITLNGGSNYNGAIGSATFWIQQINVNGNAKNGGGATVANSIVLGPNTLTQSGGAITFPSGSSITLTASSDTAYGQIDASGNAVNISDGLLVNVQVPNTAVFSGAPLEVVYGGGVAPGSPITTSSNNPRFTFTGLNTSQDPAGHSTSNNVLLYPTTIPGVPSSSPASGAAMAFALATSPDAIFVNSLLNALGSLTAIAAAEAQFAPIVNGGNALLGFQTLGEFQNLWETNLQRARAADICWNRCNPCKSAGCPVLCNPCTCNGRDNAWNGEGFWLDGFGYFADQRTRQMIPGFDGQVYGVMAAVQRALSDHWDAGLGIGYAFTHIGGKTNSTNIVAANHMNENTYSATAYLGYNRGGWYFDTFFTFDWNQYRGYRDIVFPGLNRVAASNYDGQGYSLLFDTGYNIYWGNYLTFTPLASIDFQRLHIDGYTETGAGSLDLVQNSQTYNVIQSGAGLMIGFPLIYRCCNILYSEVHGIWYYDIKGYQYQNTSRFQGGGPEFTTVGVWPARSTVDVGVSTTLYTKGNWSLQLGYDAYIAADYLGQEGNASISYRF